MKIETRRFKGMVFERKVTIGKLTYHFERGRTNVREVTWG